jgi:hypothetical protein
MGAWEPFLPPIGLSNLVFPFESHITICETKGHGICVFLSLGFMDVEFPSDEAILEAMIMDPRPLLELKYLLVGYQ